MDDKLLSEQRAARAFELSGTIRPGDIDGLGHVNNAVYLRWVQEAATAHWETLASASDQAAVVWIVLRHEIDYKNPALPGDEILLRTWVGQASGLRFERFTEVVQRKDGRLLGRVRTLWCPVDPQSFRPKRISPALRDQFSS